MLLPAVLILLLLGLKSAQYSAPAVVDGVLDLQDWDEETYPWFQMMGDWEIYPDRLIDAEDINSISDKGQMITLPSHSYNKDVEGQPPSAWNLATYRIKVLNAPGEEDLGIRVGKLDSAYRLYADGRLIAANGQAGDNEWAAIANYRFQTSPINNDQSSFEIILQTSNIYDDRGLAQWPVVLGNYEALDRFEGLVSIINHLSVGALLALSLLLLIFWLILPREKALLILCVFGIFTLIRVLIVQEILVADLWPQLPVRVLNQLDYSAAYGIQFLVPASIAALYPASFPRWFLPSLLIYSLGLIAAVWIAPDYVSELAYILDGIMVLIIVATAIMLLQAVLEKRPGSGVLLLLLSCVIALIPVSYFSGQILPFYYIFAGSGLGFGILILVQCTILAREYKSAQQVEMAALKGQIRPHFIHNALSAIISTSRHDPEQSRELLIDFSDYLRGRYSYSDMDFISIEQEMEIVQTYVKLEQARFGERIQVQYQLEADHFLIPPLTLQPLVENALVHGLRGKEEGGRVTVYTRRRNRMVRIGVTDNGLGFKPGNHQDKVGLGIAIENINRRLAKLYGTGLKYYFPAGGGCEVYLEIPFKEVTNHENHAG